MNIRQRVRGYFSSKDTKNNVSVNASDEEKVNLIEKTTSPTPGLGVVDPSSEVAREARAHFRI